MSPASRDPHPLRLKIDLSELDLAFNSGGEGGQFYLDRNTGQIILLTEDTLSAFEELSEGLGDAAADGWAAAFEAAFEAADLPDWEAESVREAALVAAGPAERFLQVPEADSRAGYRDMEAFIETVTDPRLAERLTRAIQGRGAFRAFKDVLLNQSAEQQRWFALRDARQRARLLEWLEAEGIEAVNAEGGAG